MYKNNALKDIDWQEFQQLSLKEKAPYFCDQGAPIMHWSPSSLIVPCWTNCAAWPPKYG